MIFYLVAEELKKKKKSHGISIIYNSAYMFTNLPCFFFRLMQYVTLNS